MDPYYSDGHVTLYLGDSLDILPTLPDASVDSIVTDPPYELSFMGRAWDASGVAYNVKLWDECLRVLKPGGHLLAFGGTRTYHRMTVAIEDAGFEIRDSLHWIYGSGMPKSLDVSKAIDKAAGATREVVGPRMRSDGRTALAARGGDESRGDGWDRPWRSDPEAVAANGMITAPATEDAARWPTNVLLTHPPLLNDHDEPVGDACADGCVPGCPVADMDRQSGLSTSPSSPVKGQRRSGGVMGVSDGNHVSNSGHGDTGGASRFFPVFRYEAKAPASERPRLADGTAHTTVKPLALMRWFVRLITPPGGTVLDPFAGSGTTLEACVIEGLHAIGMELGPDHAALCKTRLSKPLATVLFGDLDTG
ncbi:DNA-methyltransferase [Streptomyces sp. BA2]|uniref:DNA-methyltransferase n=1 Tax=Streptomyces sp. BA2 TaxID=436595 RepID=UPI00132C9223|nr:DNA methyltransferase [Streptomyces sp. BA2]MWA08831.1 hypothetical protein [Streptomyces sp. BA2]